jgi:hypothetical protein
VQSTKGEQVDVARGEGHSTPCSALFALALHPDILEVSAARPGCRAAAHGVR